MQLQYIALTDNTPALSTSEQLLKEAMKTAISLYETFMITPAAISV